MLAVSGSANVCGVRCVSLVPQGTKDSSSDDADEGGDKDGDVAESGGDAQMGEANMTSDPTNATPEPDAGAKAADALATLAAAGACACVRVGALRSVGEAWGWVLCAQPAGPHERRLRLDGAQSECLVVGL